VKLRHNIIYVFGADNDVSVLVSDPGRNQLQGQEAKRRSDEMFMDMLTDKPDMAWFKQQMQRK
jgi:hypothetical protein